MSVNHYDIILLIAFEGQKFKHFHVLIFHQRTEDKKNTKVRTKNSFESLKMYDSDISQR